MAVETIITYQIHDKDGRWLAEREHRKSNNDLKYNWSRSRTVAADMTYNQAQKARLSYGGQVIRSEMIVEDHPVGEFYG